MVAQHADAWNATGESPEEFARLGSILDAHCVDVGRGPNEIRRTVQLRIDGPLDGLAAEVRAYRDAGASEFILVLPRTGNHLTVLDEIATTLPTLRSAVGC